jgi:hypothetical protein
VAAEVLKSATAEFTQEEGFGRHFDVLDLFARFKALPQLPENIATSLTYTQYLTRLSVFHDIPVKRAEFTSYVTDLRDYLVGFAKRVKPLVDHEKVSAKMATAFEEEWAKKAVPGWEKTADAEQSLESVDLNKYVNAKALESLGADALRVALQKRGLKFGGSVADRAKRLFLVKDLSPDKYPKKLRAKKRAPASDAVAPVATGMYVCMYVCMLCMYLFICICMYVCIFVGLRPNTFAASLLRLASQATKAVVS